MQCKASPRWTSQLAAALVPWQHTGSLAEAPSMMDVCFLVCSVCVFFNQILREQLFFLSFFFFFFNYQCLYLKITLQTDLWGNAAPSFKGKFAFLHIEELFLVIYFSMGALQGPFLILSFKMVWFYISSNIIEKFKFNISYKNCLPVDYALQLSF